MHIDNIFHETLIARTITACEKLCRDDVQVFKPELIKELGLQEDSQETSGMISLMFQMNLIPNYKLVKGRNGGIKKIGVETKREAKSDRKCGKCGKNGHNARTCTEEIVIEETSSTNNNVDDVSPENNNDPEWLLNNNTNDTAVGE